MGYHIATSLVGKSLSYGNTFKQTQVPPVDIYSSSGGIGRRFGLNGLGEINTHTPITILRTIVTV